VYDQKAKAIEGLDWIRVEDLIHPSYGASNPEAYTQSLRPMLNYLPDVNPELDDKLREEAKRRIEAGEMLPDQVRCYAETLRRQIEDCVLWQERRYA
jgi:hypothetical protein